ncbi:MAG: hypothetical protein QM736_18840 [Vicinamibacterales bacterium]
MTTSRAAGADRIAFTALVTTQQTFDFELPVDALHDLEPAAWRRRVLRALSAAVVARMFPTRGVVIEPRASRAAGEMLRLASYHSSQLWPEVRAQLAHQELQNRHQRSAHGPARRLWFSVVRRCARAEWYL